MEHGFFYRIYAFYAVFTLSTLFVTICLLTNWISIRHGVPIGILCAFVLVLVLEPIAIFFRQSHKHAMQPVMF